MAEQFEFPIDDALRRLQEVEEESFVGRKEYVDPFQKFYNGPSLYKILNYHFQAHYAFEETVFSFLEYFKQQQATAEHRKAN